MFYPLWVFQSHHQWLLPPTVPKDIWMSCLIINIRNIDKVSWTKTHHIDAKEFRYMLLQELNDVHEQRAYHSIIRPDSCQAIYSHCQLLNLRDKENWICWKYIVVLCISTCIYRSRIPYTSKISYTGWIPGFPSIRNQLLHCKFIFTI